MSCRLSLVLRLFCFVFVFIFSLQPWPFVQSFFDICRRPNSQTCFFLFPFFLLFLWRCRFFFRVFFRTIAVFSLYREYVVRFFLPDGVLLLCDHGLDFFREMVKIGYTRWLCRHYRVQYPSSSKTETAPGRHLIGQRRPLSYRGHIFTACARFWIFNSRRIPDSHAPYPITATNTRALLFSVQPFIFFLAFSSVIVVL